MAKQSMHSYINFMKNPYPVTKFVNKSNHFGIEARAHAYRQLYPAAQRLLISD